MNNLIPASSLVECNGEPRILDTMLAERLEFSYAPEVRRLIERNRDELEMHGEVYVTATQTSLKGGRPGKAYYLNEGQALVICALSRTPKAAEVRKLLIDVFMAWRRGKTVDVKQHYRRPPSSVPTDMHFELTATQDGKMARVHIILPFGKALTLMKSIYTLD